MHSRYALLLLAGLFSLSGCDHWGVVAPDGARLVVAVNRDTLRGPGDSAIISASVLLESGDLVGYDAVVTFSTTRGGLCVPENAGAVRCDDSPAPGSPAVETETREGVARILLRSGPDTGSARVVIQSGEARDSLFVPIVPAEPSAPEAVQSRARTAVQLTS